MSSFFRTVGSDSDTDSSDEELLSDASGSDSGLEGKKKAASGAASLKNRFLRGGSDSDDSDDDDDDMDDSDSDEDKPVTAAAGSKANKFLVGADSDSDSDSEDESRRIVKSAKSKRQDEIDASVKIMENGTKINDWVVISAGSCHLYLRHLSLMFL